MSKNYTEEIINKIKAMKDPYIITYVGADKKDIGYVICLDGKVSEMSAKVHDDALLQFNVDSETIKYLQSVSPEERKRLKTQAEIYFHQKEIERLQKEIL